MWLVLGSFQKRKLVNYERARDDGLLLVFTFELGIISFETALKAHRKLTTANLFDTKVISSVSWSK